MFQIKPKSARIALLIVGAAGLAAAKPMSTMFAILSGFTIPSYSITAGGTTSATATVTLTKTGGIPNIAFSSTNTSVATVPASKLASNGSAVVTVTGVGAGCAVIKATYGGNTRSDRIVVHAAPGTTAFGFKVPNQAVPWPGAAEGTLTKTVSLSGTNELTINRAVWSLTSSNPAIVEVPSSVTQVSSSTTFPIKGKSDGCATITARLGTQSISRTVWVQYIGG
jgi:hypothetical protein